MDTAENKNFYELLGVQPTATKEEIREAYRELARIFHPDSHFYDEILESAGIAPTESQTFKLITDAYNTLCNDAKRAEYDKKVPSNLPNWDDPTKDPWHFELRSGSNKGPYSAARPQGTFGTAPNRRPASAFDEESLRSVRPVSEIIRRQRSWIGRLFGMVGL